MTRSRYPIGRRFRAALACLEQLQECEDAALPGAVEQISALPSLQSALVEKLVSRRSVQASAIAHALGQHRPWAPADRRRFGFWIAAHDPPMASAWLDEYKRYPNGDTPHDWRARVWCEQTPRLPLLTMFSNEEIVARVGALNDIRSSHEEEHFFTHRAFAAAPENRDAAVGFLRSAMTLRNDATIAALFESEALDGAALFPVVLEAFHGLAWSMYGWIKKDYLRRNAAPAMKSAAALRFAALRQWAVDHHADAVAALAKIDGDEVPLRERFMLLAAARVEGMKVDVPADTLNADDEAAWLRVILRSEEQLPLGKLETVLNLPLPPPDHPLLGIAVRFAVRKAAPLVNARELLERFERSLDAHDPMWGRFIPDAEREYARIRNGLLDAKTPSVAAALLERMLSMPIDLDWIERVLFCVQTKMPAAWLRYDDDTATPIADVATDCCIRTIEDLLLRGVEPSEERQRQLCGGSSAAVIATTMALINEWRRSRRPGGIA